MKIIPSGPALAQSIVTGLVTALAVAWIIANVPALRAWLRKENGD